MPCHNKAISGLFTCQAGLDYALICQVVPPTASSHGDKRGSKKCKVRVYEGGWAQIWRGLVFNPGVEEGRIRSVAENTLVAVEGYHSRW